MQPHTASAHHTSPALIDGRLALTTPEGVRLLLVPAGPAPRAIAWLLDILLVLLIGGIGTVLLAIASPYNAGGLFLLLLFALWWGYPIVFEQWRGGRTPGKKAMGLMVLRDNGLPVGWRESIVRNLLLVADFLPFLYLTGLLSMLFDGQFRRLGDVVAGTVVVHESKLSRPLVALAAEPEPLPWPLRPEQQRLLISLFEREAKLPPARVQELATLARPLTGRTGAESLQRLRSLVAGLLQ